MATDKATVILYDPITCMYYKKKYGKLKKLVRNLENFAVNECPYYTDISVAQYKMYLKLTKDCSMRYIDFSTPVEGKWFTIKEIGWLKGLPLVTIDIQNNEWDSD